jgi:hypothetical protein
MPSADLGLSNASDPNLGLGTTSGQSADDKRTLPNQHGPTEQDRPTVVLDVSSEVALHLLPVGSPETPADMNRRPQPTENSLAAATQEGTEPVTPEMIRPLPRCKV